MLIAGIAQICVLPEAFAKNPLLGRNEIKEVAAPRDSAENRNIESILAQKINNFIAIKTGKVRNGEQIPVPLYADGSLADRKDCKYFVSPNELSTAFTYLGGAGSYYIKCAVDENGFVQAALWQYDTDGKEINVIEDKSYEDLQKYYKKIGTQYEGSDSFRNQLTADLKKKAVANYLAIAIKASQNE